MTARVLVPLGDLDGHRTAGIGRVRPFQLLESTLLPWLSGTLRPRQVAPGEPLAAPGRPVAEAILLGEGAVTIELCGLAFGEVEGPRCLLLEEAHAGLPPLFTFRASGPVSCLALPQAAVKALAQASAPLRAMMARRAARRRAQLRSLESFLVGPPA